MDRKTFVGWPVAGVLALLALVAAGAAANSNTVSYQGVLRDAAQAPVADGAYAMRFSIFSVDTGGASVWGPETQTVTTRNGLFSVNLGSVLTLGTVFADYAALWLQIEVDLDGGAGLEVYSPRVPLASVPYAQHAKNSDTVDGQHASAFAAASHVHDAGAITSGTLSTDWFSAFADLDEENKIGTGVAQVAAGNHTHALDDLSNVNAPSPSNNQLLAWNNATSQWQNIAPPPAISDQSASGFVRIGAMQICWGKSVLSGSNHVRSFSFTFPAVFAAVPVVTNGINATSSGYGYVVYDHSISTSTYAGSIVDIQYRNSPTIVTMNYTAIGRWQ